MGRAAGSVRTVRELTAAYGYAPFRFEDAIGTRAVSERGLRSAMGAGQVVRLRPGVAVVRSALEAVGEDSVACHELQLRAVQLSLPEAGWASEDSAALLHAIPTRLAAGYPRAVSVHVPGRPDVLLDPLPVPDGLPALLPVHLHGGELPAQHRTEVDGIAVVSAARVAVDVARGRPLRQALVPLDAVLRRLAAASAADPRAALAECPELTIAARAELAEVVTSMTRWPGVVAVRNALALADPLAESPLESASRGHIITAGLPVPELAVRVVVEGRTYFLDMHWRAQRVAGECDGWSKYTLGGDPMQALRAEKRREDDLRPLFRHVVRWTSDEMRWAPEVPLDRLRRALYRT